MSIRMVESTGHRSSATRSTPSARTSRATPVEICNPWVGRQSPCTAAEETALVADLESRCDPADIDEFERRDVTVLITALRCGLSAAELLHQAPGIKAHRLVAAHRELENRRLLAEHAWRTIAVDPRLETFHTFAPCASELLPAVTSHLASYRHDADDFARAVGDAAESVTRTSRRVLVLEQRLSKAGADPSKARELGTLLYDVYGQGAWSLPTFLPPRVGALVPMRLGALLGDEISTSRRAS